MNQLKVFGGLKFKSDGQHRIIVAVHTKKELAEILEVGLYVVNRWWARTGNTEEIKKATQQPFTLIDVGKI